MLRVAKFVFLLALFVCVLAACDRRPKSTEAPLTKDGKPVLADVGGQFQVTVPYYELAISRVPVASRYQYLTPDGKRQFLEKLAIEAVYYLEGKRRKFYLEKDFRNMLKLRHYYIYIEEGRKEILKGLSVTDEQVKAEYDATIKDKDAFPFDKMKEEIRYRLLERELDKAVESKKDELRKTWGVKMHYDVLALLNPQSMKNGTAPALDQPLAEGAEYKYTVDQFLKRLDLAPPEVREKAERYPDPVKMLDFFVGEDLLSAWVQKANLDKSLDLELRKKILEVGALSAFTRQQIVGRDIFATPTEARTYYDKHAKEFEQNGQVAPFDKIKDLVIVKVTEKRRDEATRGLAQSLMAHRYPVVYFEPNVRKYLQ